MICDEVWIDRFNLMFQSHEQPVLTGNLNGNSWCITVAVTWIVVNGNISGPVSPEDSRFLMDSLLALQCSFCHLLLVKNGPALQRDTPFGPWW